MEILKIPFEPKTIKCECGCVFNYGVYDVKSRITGWQPNSRVTMFVECPLCENEHIVFQLNNFMSKKV